MSINLLNKKKHGGFFMMNESRFKAVRNVICICVAIIVVFGLAVGSFANKAAKVMASETSTYDEFLYEAGLAEAEVVIEEEEVPLADQKQGAAVMWPLALLALIGAGVYLKVGKNVGRKLEPEYKYSLF